MLLLLLLFVCIGRVGSYVASKAGQDSLASHISDVVAKKTASEADLGTPHSNFTGFTGWSCWEYSLHCSVQGMLVVESLTGSVCRCTLWLMQAVSLSLEAL